MTTVNELISKGRKAQESIANYTQEQVDRLVAAIVYDIVTDDKKVESMARMAVDETQLGDYESKLTKVRVKCRGVLFDLKKQKSVGIVEENTERGLVRMAKPVGVIGSLVPSTQPEMHPLIQTLFSLKAKNAIIFSPHPGAKKTTSYTVQLIRETLKKYGASEDLVLCIDEPSLDKTNELMRDVDLVIATGGQPMVKAAYSSGTPAYGVGAGNANIYVDKSAKLKDAATKIKSSKTFDLAAGCSCDNAIVIHESVYEEMLEELKLVGGQIVTTEEKKKIQKAIWPEYPKNTMINREIVAKPVTTIGKIANIAIEDSTQFLLVEEVGSGFDYPFSGEKMSLVIAVYKVADVDEAIQVINSNQQYSGSGHSCGVYSENAEVIDKVATETFTTRVVVNQPQSATNTGSWTSGMPFTSSLGCGTWGGNIASENIELKHYLNNTWIIREIPFFGVADEELFEGFEPV